jgi:hypothetical protein
MCVSAYLYRLHVNIWWRLSLLLLLLGAGLQVMPNLLRLLVAAASQQDHTRLLLPIGLSTFLCPIC